METPNVEQDARHSSCLPMAEGLTGAHREGEGETEVSLAEASLGREHGARRRREYRAQQELPRRDFPVGPLGRRDLGLDSDIDVTVGNIVLDAVGRHHKVLFGHQNEKSVVREFEASE